MHSTDRISKQVAAMMKPYVGRLLSQCAQRADPYQCIFIVELLLQQIANSYIVVGFQQCQQGRARNAWN